jgi:hypothetical protein
MCNESLNDSTTELSTEVEFEQFREIAESEFTIEEALIEYDVPTFYVRLGQDSKKAFLRLAKRLDAIGFIPILRKKQKKIMLQIISKPPVKPSRRIINLILFLLTIGTVLLAGYLQSLGLAEFRPDLMPNPFFGAVMFTSALIAILGAHEGAHKIAAGIHGIEASYPYFIPGLPPIGTFGAVIQQKSLAPNKDCLFDLGVSGPLVGFIVAIIVTIIGVPLSGVKVWVGESVLPGSPILFGVLANIFPPSGTGDLILLHPVAFAGWVGMFVTLLNLVPAGMLDGGHAVRSMLGQKASRFLSIFVIIILLVLNPSLYWLIAILAFFFSLQRHPGPLDDVSKLTTSRKLVAVVLILIFVLCFAPLWF